MGRARYYYYTFRKSEVADILDRPDLAANPNLDLPVSGIIMPPAGDSPKTSRAYLLFLVLIASVGPLQFGFHLAELNAPSKVIRCDEKEPPSAIRNSLPKCIPMKTSEFGIVQSIYTLGGLVGALLAGPAATKHGRLLTMRLTTLVFIVGPIAEALAASIPTLGFGRFLSGVGAGASTVVCPIYISEIAPRDKRGFYGSYTQGMVNVGIFITLLLGYFLSHGNYWRIILGAAGLIGVNMFVGLAFAVESPKWLADHKKVLKARQVLRWIRGPDADIDSEIKSWKTDPASSSAEQASLLSDSNEQQEAVDSPISFAGAIMSPKYRPAVISVMAVMAAQQFTGINSIMMYSVDTLGGLLPISATLLTVAVALINVAVTFACAPLADRIGRKTCLLYSIAGMGISSVVLAISLATDVKILSALATLTFVSSFAVGLGPVPFILASELVGPEAVGATQSWALASNWISTFIVAQFFPIVESALGGHGRAYYIFAVLGLLLGSFIAWWVPETNGKKSAEEVWGPVLERREE